MTGVEMIAAERLRQIESEGWTEAHDDTHRHGEMAKAAACYALYGTNAAAVTDGGTAWPWDLDRWWKPSTDAVRNLVRAGALIAAEIDRIKRAAPTGS